MLRDKYAMTFHIDISTSLKVPALASTGASTCNHGNRRMRRLVPVAAAALLAGGPVHAQDITGEIDRMFSWATPSTPGCAVGVSRNGEVLVNRAYGMADLEHGVALTPETPLDIGSVTKQFVAASILLLVDEGRISLSDDVHRYVPELPDYGHAITIDHLLTHTSGIRDWTWLSSVTEHRDDPLTLIVRQRGLNFAPGEEWSYSNSGYELLREVVARVSGQPLAEFMRTRLFEPLGMRHTRYAADASAVPNAAMAYEKQGEQWTKDVLLGNARGGGGVFSTAGDLLVWNDALTNNRLGPFVSAKIQEPARLANGRTLDYARGLFLDDDGEIVWHSGDAAAYNAMLARLPREGVSLALLCNGGDVSDDGNYEVAIMDLLVPRDATSAAASAGTPPAVEVSPEELASRAGLFFSERTGDPLRLAVSDGRLRVAGGPALVALGGDRFRNPRRILTFMSQDEFELRFVSPDQLELISMEGATTRYRRARPYAPAAAELAAFAGRYETDEIGTVEVTPGGSGLSSRLNGSPAIEFAPVDPDVFQRGQMTLRFRRDAAGRVIGLDLTSPALRNAHFPRRGDVSTSPEPASTQTQPAGIDLRAYEGTYALQGPDRTVDLRVWVDEQGRLSGEMVGTGQQTTFRPTSTEHRFLHATRDDVAFQFTMENGRATAAAMEGAGGRRMSGPRKP
jgi:CubicO group peptidase (beta-lactamase class C family)